jgi:hypothetical protein
MIPKSTAWRVVTSFSRRCQAALPAPEKNEIGVTIGESGGFLLFVNKIISSS